MAQVPDNKKIYDANWKTWEAMKRFGPMSRHTQRLVMNICRSLAFESVLDVGCGPGIFLDILSKNFPDKKLAGTDLSSAAIDLAKKHLPNSQFYEIDIVKETPPGSWDLVTMIDVAEHIENDVAAFENLKKICNKYLLVVTLEGRMRDFEPEIGHVRNYKPGELRQKLEQAGYSIKLYKHWGWPMYSPLYRNMSQGINAHNTEMSKLRRLMATIAHMLLFLNVPAKGDLVFVVASPKGKINA